MDQKKPDNGASAKEAAPPIQARLVPIDRLGKYRIEANGYSLTSRFPENRLAKVLFDAGYRGRLEVYGPTNDASRIILRATYDTEKMAAGQMTEDARGIRFVPWTEKSLAALEQATKRQPYSHTAFNDPAHADGAAPVQNSSMAKGFQVEKPDRPTTKEGQKEFPIEANTPARADTRNRGEIHNSNEAENRRK